MGHWGWRRMLTFCVSVFVVGCSTTHDAAPTFSPTNLPPVTLMARAATESPPPSVIMIPLSTPITESTPTHYTIQVGDTLLGIAARFGVPYEVLKAANADLNPLALPINQAIMIPNPQFDAAGTPILPTSTPAQLELPSPTCYPSPTSSILCMGWVANNILQPVERVVLYVRLLRRDGSLLAEGEVGLEQGVIPTGASAPYRVLFNANWLEYASAVVSLRSADIASAAAEKRVSLQIEGEQQHLENGFYIVSATLRNDAAASVHLLRAVLTLRDNQGHITGYRVLPLDGDLADNALVNIDISAVSQTSGSVSHTLFVEAIKNN
ncbi:MAG: LysM peptidoglycan-binding domain-containing protein [Anaerolineaceae bacterium]|nr:LysM peptidoglycan-binding domain-containing protein [Anaerolineaceae bacterium]